MSDSARLGDSDLPTSFPHENEVGVEPVLAQLVGESLPAARFASATPAAPWRLWTVFLAVIVALVVMLGLSAIAAIPFIFPVLMDETARADPAALTAAVSSPWAFFAQGLAGQVGLAAVALMAAYLSPIGIRERVGLVDSGLSNTQWLAVGFGSLAPAAVGIVLAQLLALVLAPDETASKLFAEMPVLMVVPWILFIALAPGFGEEILFRGYVQRRLLKRWSPWLSIVVSSAIFALIHFMPLTVVFAFPIGVWFGCVAWKTGSIWPTILGHALINGLWNVLNISKYQLGYSDSLYWSAAAAMALLGVVAFAWALPKLSRLAAPQPQQA